MNTKLLMLGILLIAGLSFAIGDWKTYVVDRYGCNDYYLGHDYCPDGCYGNLMGIADGHGGDVYWTSWGDMKDDISDMDDLLWGDGTPGMCYYSGCYPDMGGTYTSEFRSSMLAYNVAAADLKAKFLAGLRNYLADGGDRAEILADLQDAMAGYRACVADAAEYGSCYMCGY